MQKACVSFFLLTAACGQTSDLSGDSDKNQSAATKAALSSTDEESSNEETQNDDETAGDAIHSDGEPSSDPAPENTKPIEIPELPTEDAEALKRCLKGWHNAPFQGNVTNFKRIYAAVTVGGQGSAISDTERTEEPWLILIDAGVNVFGSPKYELLNPNGWYCMKVNVNVISNLTIDLHCSARLADSRVNVNVGSNQSGTNSMVGVNVFSTVDVENVAPEGDSCIRK